MRKRLLLVSMSGVRVRNERLLALGMTLPGFVERSKVIASLPSLSLLTIATHTPGDGEIIYEEIEALPDIDALVAGGYSLVGISSFTARIDDGYRLADDLGANGMTVVLGGSTSQPSPSASLTSAPLPRLGETRKVKKK
jgi:hypothetical protein